jgi:hypothetical protein
MIAFGVAASFVWLVSMPDAVGPARAVAGSEAELVEVPASTQLGPLMVMGWLGDETEMRRFVLDTRATQSALTPETSQALGVETSGESVFVSTLYGAVEENVAGRPLQFEIAANPSFGQTLTPLIYQQGGPQDLLSSEYDALVGADFLAGRNIEIDWAGASPRLFIGPRTAPIEARDWRPYAKLSINGYEVSCLVDTGWALAGGPLLSVSASMRDEIMAGEPTVLIEGGRRAALLIERFIAEVAIGDGEPRRVMVEAEKLKPDSDATLGDVSVGPDCFIGPSFLQNFHTRFAPDGVVTLDWRGRPVVEHNRAGLGGLTVDNEREAFRAGVITPGSPADQAGLSQGDIILSVDGEPLTFETLGAFRQAVLGDAGRSVSIRFERAGEVQETSLVLRDLME